MEQAFVLLGPSEAFGTISDLRIYPQGVGLSLVGSSVKSNVIEFI